MSYALTPGHLTPDDPIDLSDKLGRDLYNRAVEPLKVPFDESSKNVHLLQSQFKIRAKKSGWDKGTDDIINIATPGGKKSVLTKYGCFTTAQLTAVATTYCKITTVTRAAQNNIRSFFTIISF